MSRSSLASHLDVGTPKMVHLQAISPAPTRERSTPRAGRTGCPKRTWESDCDGRTFLKGAARGPRKDLADAYSASLAWPCRERLSLKLVGNPNMPNPFAHIELSTDDVAKAKKFYKSVFDWNLADLPEMGYTMINVGSGTGGGMTKKSMPEQPTAWLPYVQVDDVKKTIAKAAKGGARVIVAYQDIGNMGAIGIFMDPSGAGLGVWQSGAGAPPPPAEKPVKKTPAKKAAKAAPEKAAKAAPSNKATAKTPAKKASPKSPVEKAAPTAKKPGVETNTKKSSKKSAKKR